MTSAAAVEEELIKKRLLIEGDSGNDDRLINKLTKYYVKWTNSLMTNQPPVEQNGNSGLPQDEESTAFLNEQIVAALAHTEISLLRNQFILNMNRSEQENYQVLYKKIDDEIEKAKHRIVEKKAELQEARKIRKNRQEYDVIARQILAYPDRMEMQATIRNLEAKMESLKKSESECERKIELRRKQFGVVLESLSSLKNLIESDTNLEQYLSSQAELLDDESMMMDASNLVGGPAAETLVNQEPKLPAGLISDQTTVKATTNEISSSQPLQQQQTPSVKTEILDDANDDGDDDADVEKSEKHQSSASLANLANASLVSPVEVEMEDANTPAAAD